MILPLTEPEWLVVRLTDERDRAREQLRWVLGKAQPIVEEGSNKIICYYFALDVGEYTRAIDIMKGETP